MTAPTAKRSRGRTPFPDLHALEIFLAVVDGGSMTSAARRLYLTQPAVSKAVAQLEHYLKTSLLDRSLRPIRPTRAGTLLHQKASRLLADAENLRHGVSMATDEVLPSIRIGLVASFMATGASLIRSLQGIADEVRVSSSLTPDLARGLLERDFDVLITSDPMEDTAGLERIVILQEPFVIAMPTSFHRANSTIELKALAAQLPFIRYTSRSIIGTTIERHLRRYNIAVARRLEFDSSASMLTMVGADLGWTITTPLCLLQGAADFRKLHISPLSAAPLARRLYVVARAKEMGDAVHRIQTIATKVARESLTSGFPLSVAWVLKQIEFGK